ncbi:MAG TPA: hypothetical protein VFG20_06890 [Planctomycetaceae bacterium]|nr:hypothetical protein [Planctomycetaceae bacterium]
MSETVTECAECHLRSILESQFRVGFTRAGKRARLCPVCWRRDQASNARIRAYWIFGVGVLGFFLPDSPLRWFILGVTSGYFLAQLLTPLHEAAHALAAYVLGFHLNQFKIGWWSEPVVWLRWGRCTVELCGLVEGGMVLATTKNMRWFRVRQILITAAGPGLHLVLVVIAVAVRYRAPLGSWIEWIATIVFLTNGFELVHNLYPRTVASPDGPVRNDGMLILNWCFAKPEDLRQQRLAYIYHECLYLLHIGRYDDGMQLAKTGRAEFPDDPNMESLEAFCWSSSGSRDEAKARYQALRYREDLPPEADAAILSFLIYLDLMEDDPEQLKEALEYSERAYSMLPWDSMIKGPRGAALVASGQVDAGLNLLQQAFHQCFEPESRAFHAAFIAWGKHQQGDSVGAHRYLEMAKRLEPRADSIERVEGILNEKAATSVVG